MGLPFTDTLAYPGAAKYALAAATVLPMGSVKVVRREFSQASSVHGDGVVNHVRGSGLLVPGMNAVRNTAGTDAAVSMGVDHPSAVTLSCTVLQTWVAHRAPHFGVTTWRPPTAFKHASNAAMHDNVFTLPVAI